MLGDHPKELQGLRGTVQYAQGKFSAATGMHSMGVRAYDPARGVWLSADIYIGQNLELQFNSADEANLYQYSGNNPVVASDPSGKNLITKALKISFSRDPLGAILGFASTIEGNYRRITSEDSSLAMRFYGAVCIVNDTLNPVPIDCDDIDYISQSLYEFANSFNYSNVTTETSFEATIAKSSSLIGDMPVNNVKAVSEKVQKHHIATDKKKTATANTQAWTPKFEKIFNQAGMSLKNDPANLVDIPGHSGRHSEEYHSTVFDRISKATEQCKPGPDFAKALRGELSNLAKELVTRDSELNQMVRRVGPYARQDKGSSGSRTNYSQSGRSFREIQRDRSTDRGKH